MQQSRSSHVAMGTQPRPSHAAAKAKARRGHASKFKANGSKGQGSPMGIQPRPRHAIAKTKVCRHVHVAKDKACMLRRPRTRHACHGHGSMPMGAAIALKVCPWVPWAWQLALDIAAAFLGLGCMPIKLPSASQHPCRGNQPMGATLALAACLGPDCMPMGTLLRPRHIGCHDQGSPMGT